MEFLYSSVVDPSTYDNEGLSEGIALRKNAFTTYEDRGAIRAQEDWNNYVRPMKQHFKGTLAERFSFMSVSVPECIPERLEIISYANEFAFMHDDVTELETKDNGENENDEMMEAFLEGASGASIAVQDHSASGGKRRMQSKLLLEMMEIDRDCAIVTMKAWAKFVEVGSSRQHATVFDKLEDYLPYRIMDVGEMFWFGVVTFGMALKIPEDEIDLCKELMQPAWVAVGLANDVFSWPKERDAAELLGHDHVVNAIWVLMKEHDMTEEQAERRCRELSAKYVANYVETVRRVQHDHSISPGLRRYVEAMQYSISGNIAWSKTCPRYNPSMNFNSQQLEWMKIGVPDLQESSSVSDSSRDDNSTGSNTPHKSESQTTMSATSSENESILSCLSDCSIPALQRKVRAVSDTHPYMAQAGSKQEVKIIRAPFRYIDALPSKGARDMFIDAVTSWIPLDSIQVAEVKQIIRHLHNASLMLDDVQDSSYLRRGKPSTHMVFGVPQTINSAMFIVNQALQSISSLAGDAGVAMGLQTLSTLFVGQGQDLHSSYNLACPSMVEYIQTIDSKTGALFQLATELVILCSDMPAKCTVDMSRLCILLGRCFQIRDDYQNLASLEYKEQKGFCEDLDVGTYTFPLVLLLLHEPDNLLLQNLLSTRLSQGGLNDHQKKALLEIMHKAKTNDLARQVIEYLRGELEQEVKRLSGIFKTENPQMELLLKLLAV